MSSMKLGDSLVWLWYATSLLSVYCSKAGGGLPAKSCGLLVIWELEHIIEIPFLKVSMHVVISIGWPGSALKFHKGR